MEIEREQINSKLDIVKRRVRHQDSSQRVHADPLMEAVQTFVAVRHEGDKLSKQFEEQNDRIEMAKIQSESQMMQLNEMKAFSRDLIAGIDQGDNASIIDRMQEEMEIKRRLAKEVLPQELASLQSSVNELEAIERQQSPEHSPSFNEELEAIEQEISDLTEEINQIMESRMLGAKENKEDQELQSIKQEVTIRSMFRLIIIYSTGRGSSNEQRSIEQTIRSTPTKLQPTERPFV